MTLEQVKVAFGCEPEAKAADGGKATAAEIFGDVCRQFHLTAADIVARKPESLAQLVKAISPTTIIDPTRLMMAAHAWKRSVDAGNK